MKANSLGYRDMNVDDVWISSARTITQAEITLFAGLSGDFNPVHVDHAAAASGPFGQVIAHGLLGLSIASGLGTHAPSVQTVAFVKILEWSFHHPIFPGDTIRVETTIRAIEPTGRGRRALVTWGRRVLNQNDQVVQEGSTQTLVARGSDQKDSEDN